MYEEKVVLADEIVTGAYLNNTLLKFPWLAETSDTFCSSPYKQIEVFYFIVFYSIEEISWFAARSQSKHSFSYSSS